MIFKFDLGEEVKDLVTGFKGIIEARTQCLNGCIQYIVQPRVDKEKKIPEACQIDEQQLKLIKKSIFKKKDEDEKIPGGLRKTVRYH